MEKILTILILAFCYQGLAQSFISKIKDESLALEIIKLDDKINSQFDDYAPVFTIDGSEIYYTSKRPDNLKGKRNQNEKIYCSRFDFNTKQWIRATPMNDTINFSKVSNSAIGVSNDGQVLFLFGTADNGAGDIYISRLDGKEWSLPKSIGSPINSEYHETSACLSPDGKTIYFVSDRENGQGKRDIWFSSLNENGEWGKPINMGKNINSKYDEEAVFLHPNGKILYFSSKGHGSMGGYDVFYSVNVNDVWSEPKPAPGKINTVGDDLFFTLRADESVGYYSTNNSSNQKDIYEIKFNTNNETNIKSDVLVLKGEIREYETDKPLEAFIQIYDSISNKTIREIKSNYSNGKFMISLPSNHSYTIKVKEQHHQEYTYSLNLTENSNDSEIFLNVKLKNSKSETDTLKVRFTKQDVSKMGGNDGKIELIIEGGQKPYAFDWSNGYKLQNLYNLKSGTYLCKILDNEGMSHQISIEIKEPSKDLALNKTIDTNIQYLIHYFSYGQNQLSFKNPELLEFLTRIEKEIMNGKQKIDISIYSSSSNVPMLNSLSNLDLSKKRAENAKNLLLNYFNQNPNLKNKINIKIISYLVSGPRYNNDFEDLNKYKPFQYVKLKYN